MKKKLKKTGENTAIRKITSYLTAGYRAYKTYIPECFLFSLRNYFSAYVVSNNIYTILKDQKIFLTTRAYGDNVKKIKITKSKTSYLIHIPSEFINSFSPLPNYAKITLQSDSQIMLEFFLTKEEIPYVV